jgi:proton-dependent oligopeptide transporter, POT family
VIPAITTPAVQQPAAGVPQRAATDWFGHPRGLTILFLTETWEKFSYFGMRSILVYYMTKELLFEQSAASVIYGSYTAFVYFTPIVGGIIIDRYLGRTRAVIIGGLVMAVGHFLMTFESLFFVALATIALGNGLFLPGLPSQIADLYKKDDPRRKVAYNVYYVGINLGGFLAPLVCGTVGELYGWHWGFALAGVGMVVGLVIYISARRWLPARTQGPSATSEQVTPPAIPAPVAILAIIWTTVIVFRAAYAQIGNTIALWADSGVDRAVGQSVIPMTWFQSLNPLLVLALTPALLGYWARKEKRGQGTSSLRKMAAGAGIVAFSYVVLAVVTGSQASDGATVSWGWLFAFLFIITAGELCVLPIGLGLFGRLAPQKFSATFIAAWFLAAFGGNLCAGLLGSQWTALGPTNFFSLLAVIAVVSGICFWTLDAKLRRFES